MNTDPDYIVDIDGLEDHADEAPGRPLAAGRKWIGVRFDCCGSYQRIYRNETGTAYEGKCPRCLRKVRALIGSGGTTARFFVAE